MSGQNDVNPIRVLHLVLSLDMGGLEKLVYELARRAPAFGVQARVACMDHGGHFAERLTRDGVAVTELHRRGALNLWRLWRLSRLCRREGIEVIHSHSGCMLYAAMLRWMLPRLRIVHTDHGRHYPEVPLVCTEERLAARWVDRIVPVSHSLADYMAREVRLPTKRMEVIWNGVDLEQFQPPSPEQRLAVRAELGIPADARVVGTVGRLATVKNQALLLAAFAIVCNRMPKTHLLVVGDGTLRDALRQQAEKINLVEHITFTGERGDVHRMLWAMDVFALSSDSEALPVTLLEAVATGLPFVVTAVGDMSRVAAQCGNGAVVPMGRTEPFAEALATSLACTGVERRRPVQAEALALETMIHKYVALYRACLGRDSGAQ